MPKSARIWKFLNSLVPKMFDMDSEDEDDDPTELQQPDRPESIHSEEQEEQEEQEEHSGGDSILSELALGPSFRDVANNALKDFTKEGENVMEGTENGWEEERLRQLNGLRSELLQLTAEQRGAKRRSQDVEQAPNCKEDLFSAYSGITQVATARRTSSSRAATLMLLLRHHQKNKYHRDKEAVATARRTSSSRAATLMLLLRHHQKNKYHRDKEAVTVRNGIYDDTAAIDDDVAASSPAENRGAVLPTDLTDDASSPASSLIEEPIDDSQRSLCALDEALTEDQTWEEQFLVKLSVWADTENNLSETVPSDELRNDSLWSEEYTEDEAASSQPRSGELTEDLLERRHGPSPFSSAKPGDEDDCTANNNECCITTSFALARRYPTLFKLAPRIHPATAALLLEDPSLITWQRETLAQGENPFAREGNLKYVPFGLPGTWTRYGYAEILPFNASSALGHHSPDPNQNSLFHKLPPELREKVYYHVFQLRGEEKQHSGSYMQGHIETALMQTCRSIYFEARCMPLSANSFQFQRCMYAMFFLDRLSAPQQRCLRSLGIRSGTRGFAEHQAEPWAYLFNLLFELYACGTRLRTLTVTVTGTWEEEIEQMIGARWASYENALHYIEDFYFTIEDSEVSYETKAALHTKWATFLTGHAKEWPPLEVWETSSAGIGLASTLYAGLSDLESGNVSLEADSSTTGDGTNQVESTADTAAEISQDQTLPEVRTLELKPLCAFLERLTPDLRMRIYGFAFRIQGQDPAWQPRWFQGHIDTSLLYTNSKIWQEAHFVLAMINTFTFTCPLHANRFLQDLPQTLHNSVKHIRILATAESFRWDYGKHPWAGLFRQVESMQQGATLLDSLAVVIQGPVFVCFGADIRDAWKDLGGTLFPLSHFYFVFDDAWVTEETRNAYEQLWGRFLVSNYVFGEEAGPLKSPGSLFLGRFETQPTVFRGSKALPLRQG